MNPSPTPPLTRSAASEFHALRSAWMLSLFVFLVHVAHEILVAHHLYGSQRFLIGILQASLAGWAIVEVALLRRRGCAIPLRMLTLALGAQLALVFVRFGGQLLSRAGAPPVSSGYELGGTMVYGPLELVLFVAISKLLIDAFSFAQRKYAQDLEAQMEVIERIQQSLRQSEERYRLIADQVDDLIWTMSTDRRFDYLSRSTQALLGWTAEEVLGRRFPELLTASSWASTSELLERVASAADADTPAPAQRSELELLRKDGSTVWAEVTINALRDGSGRFSGFTGIARDISERRRRDAELSRYRMRLEELVADRTAQLAQALEQAEAANRAKSAFLATMSHELRTPINGITGMTMLAARRSTDAKQSEFLDKVQASARHLLGIIEGVLEYARLEGDEAGGRQVEFLLPDVVERVRTTHEPAIAKKQLQLTIEVDPRLGRTPLRGDPARLQQVLDLLVDNAVKFTAAGSVAVRGTIVGGTATELRAQIEVQDTGIGIAPEDQSRLFQPFGQLDSSSTRQFGGTGLGLAIAQRLTQLMGGEIAVTSTPGVGSTFRVALRLEKVLPSA